MSNLATINYTYSNTIREMNRSPVVGVSWRLVEWHLQQIPGALNHNTVGAAPKQTMATPETTPPKKKKSSSNTRLIDGADENDDCLLPCGRMAIWPLTLSSASSLTFHHHNIYNNHHNYYRLQQQQQRRWRHLSLQHHHHHSEFILYE